MENSTGKKKYVIPNDNMINDILKKPRFKNLIDINYFFYVPNGERPAGNNWFDKDGNKTEDPKKVVTKKPVMMWFDMNDLHTNNPDLRIPEKDKLLMFPLTRDAKTKEDFEFLYKRELKIFNANDGAAFKQWLTKKVTDLLSYEQALSANESVHSAKAQDLCIKFLEWLQTERNKELEKGTINGQAGINHFCKSMPLNIVREHFEILTKVNSKNGGSFLTIDQLNFFIERAFLDKSKVSKQKIDYGSREKLFVIKRFYQFYSLAIKDYEGNSQCKPKYIRLLTDNFENWDYNSVKNNFGNKVKREW